MQEEVLQQYGFGKIREGEGGSRLASADALTLGRVQNREEAAMTAMGDDIIAAAANPGSGSAAHRIIRHDLKHARQLLEDQVTAEKRVAAALGGAVTFHGGAGLGGLLEVSYKVGRSQKTEQVTDIDLGVLKMLLEVQLSSADPLVIVNMRPLRMAQASPRTFWALVRHGGVSPARGFVEALLQLMPAAKYAEALRNLEIRDRKQSKKAIDAEANKAAMEAVDKLKRGQD